MDKGVDASLVASVGSLVVGLEYSKTQSCDEQESLTGVPTHNNQHNDAALPCLLFRTVYLFKRKFDMESKKSSADLRNTGM
jgi:hypothetical protein